MHLLRSSLACFVIAVFLAACGSSGGGGGASSGGALVLTDPNGLFTGEYQMIGMEGDNSGVEQIVALLGDATADGAGTMTLAVGENDTGVVSPPTPPSDVDYQVHVDYGFTIGNFGPNAVFARGGITEDGAMAGVMTVIDGIDPTLWLFGRRATALEDDTDVQGTWHFARYTANIAVPLNVAGWGTVDFNGAGGGTYEEWNNQEGATFGPVNPPLIYEVLSGGRIGIQFGANNIVFGSILAGGDVIFCSGSSVAGGPPTLYVLIRAGAGMADTDFTGFHHMLTIGHESGSNSYSTFTGTAQSEGMGVSQFIGMRNEDGTTTTSGIDGVLWTVAPNGAVTFTTGGGDTLHGAISPDGRVIAGAGTSNAGGDPAFFLFFR